MVMSGVAWKASTTMRNRRSSGATSLMGAAAIKRFWVRAPQKAGLSERNSVVPVRCLTVSKPAPQTDSVCSRGREYKVNAIDWLRDHLRQQTVGAALSLGCNNKWIRSRFPGVGDEGTGLPPTRMEGCFASTSPQPSREGRCGRAFPLCNQGRTEVAFVRSDLKKGGLGPAAAWGTFSEGLRQPTG